MAVPLYKQVQILIKHLDAILISLFSGCLAGIVSIFINVFNYESRSCNLLFTFTKINYNSNRNGSVGRIGGIVTITVAVIIITGVLGNMIADVVYRVFRIKEPVAKGLALGTASHAIGTAKAMEMGPVEGAMSSLAIAVAGLLTVIFASVFAGCL